MSDTVTVYVSKEWNDGVHDILATSDVETMHADGLNDGYGTVSIAGFDYDTARAWSMVDPIAYREDFLNWTDANFHELEMPWEVFTGDMSAQEEWVTEYIDEAPGAPARPLRDDDYGQGAGE